MEIKDPKLTAFEFAILKAMLKTGSFAHVKVSIQEDGVSPVTFMTSEVLQAVDSFRPADKEGNVIVLWRMSARGQIGFSRKGDKGWTKFTMCVGKD